MGGRNLKPLRLRSWFRFHPAGRGVPKPPKHAKNSRAIEKCPLIVGRVHCKRGPRFPPAAMPRILVDGRAYRLYTALDGRFDPIPLFQYMWKLVGAVLSGWEFQFPPTGLPATSVSARSCQEMRGFRRLPPEQNRAAPGRKDLRFRAAPAWCGSLSLKLIAILDRK